LDIVCCAKERAPHQARHLKHASFFYRSNSKFAALLFQPSAYKGARGERSLFFKETHAGGCAYYPFLLETWSKTLSGVSSVPMFFKSRRVPPQKSLYCKGFYLFYGISARLKSDLLIYKNLLSKRVKCLVLMYKRKGV